MTSNTSHHKQQKKPHSWACESRQHDARQASQMGWYGSCYPIKSIAPITNALYSTHRLTTSTAGIHGTLLQTFSIRFAHYSVRPSVRPSLAAPRALQTPPLSVCPPNSGPGNNNKNNEALEPFGQGGLDSQLMLLLLLLAAGFATFCTHTHTLWAERSGSHTRVLAPLSRSE